MLTKADKAWIKKLIQDEFAKAVQDLATTQLGGYDGATSTIDPDEYEGRKRVGFKTNAT